MRCSEGEVYTQNAQEADGVDTCLQGGEIRRSESAKDDGGIPDQDHPRNPRFPGTPVVGDDEKGGRA